MKTLFRHSLKRSLAFIAALTVIASTVIITSFAADKTDENATPENAASENVTKQVADYTSLFPELTGAKFKLSDPKFTTKEWYEYIEYEHYTDVKDGNITYHIYQPTDYSAASIMAITDYNPKEELRGTNSINMNLGELKGVLDIAAQGGNISKDFAGLDLANGIATKMNSINDIMDNSRYYSSSGFLGIPGDTKFIGVSNDGFYNVDSLEIEIKETETVSACKTVAIESSYSVSDSTINEKTVSQYSEASEAVNRTMEVERYYEQSGERGWSNTVSDDVSREINGSITKSIGSEIISDIICSGTHSDKKISNNQFGVEGKVGLDINVDAKAGFGKWVGDLGAAIGAALSPEFGLNYAHSWGKEEENSSSVSIGTSVGVNQTDTYEIGASIAVNDGKSRSDSANFSITSGESLSDSLAIENAITNGTGNERTNSHGQEMAAGVGYGVDYQYGNEHSLSLGVTRTFNARDDKEVKNVGWKLCEYVVKIPYYIETVKTDSVTGEETVLYGQYVNYNLLNGVSRVFANGYIEHWYTGELVTYADFFNGFITATELVENAKEQHNIQKGGK